jgi:Holliday junction resolvase
MLERDVQAKVRRYAESKGWITRKWSSMNTRGVPDCIFVNPNGYVICIEFKSENGRLSKLQKIEIDKLRGNRAVVYVVNSVGLGKFIVDLYEGASY